MRRRGGGNHCDVGSTYKRKNDLKSLTVFSSNCGQIYVFFTPLQLTQVKNVDLRVIMHAGDAIPKSGVSPRRSRNERKMMIGRALLLAWNLNKREEEEENE